MHNPIEEIRLAVRQKTRAVHKKMAHTCKERVKITQDFHPGTAIFILQLAPWLCAFLI